MTDHARAWTWTTSVLSKHGVLTVRRLLDPDDEDDRGLIEAYLRGEDR